MAKPVTKYICQNCGYVSLRWLGKCPECDSWNSFVEEIVHTDKHKLKSKSSDILSAKLTNLSKVADINITEDKRIVSTIEELDRVLGGGVVPGSVVLVGGDPGIGKSTLMMQLSDKIKNNTILYVSGEESPKQIKLRCERLGFAHDEFYILSETSLEIIAAVVDKLKPEIVIIDSIQTIYRSELESSPGSVSQLRESTAAIIQIAKAKNISFFLIGHITKEGFIAGPKVLEHMVDTVLQFEGERTHSYRVLRAIKNRFGSTNEIGIFEMTGTGLMEVRNPSEVFLSQRSRGISGSTVSASMEGTRPILIEVQALVSSSGYSVPQRTATGFDYKRLAILIAVLEKKIGIHLSKFDVFVNIAGGIKIDEPSIDLAAAISICSSFKDTSIDADMLILGEIGLSGEIRGISFAERRIQEAVKLGFKKVVLPSSNMKNFKPSKDIEYIPVESIQDAIRLIL
ncbi:MAG TPA: DNA repair protein RadA [Ignavibacteria bacterium]|nr:DNA repair protein RadA [Ignavibacteria bacterium]HAX49007.1 DNA repair protein RadA [Bacteroidota bacterium]HRE10079.1 DNA repair protein RadA [Ignavibacteria bacterium]HRF67167.1 DNA repair protein RadA [Ignavibacteria bacterium]HRJ03178.1 DNA repair protein RadA [Ignavibacteria bacterium]